VRFPFGHLVGDLKERECERARQPYRDQDCIFGGDERADALDLGMGEIAFEEIELHASPTGCGPENHFYPFCRPPPVGFFTERGCLCRISRLLFASDPLLP
jgi:hypothetical protein